MGWLDSDSFSSELIRRIVVHQKQKFTAVNIFVLLYCSSVSFFITMFTLLLSLRSKRSEWVFVLCACCHLRVLVGLCVCMVSMYVCMYVRMYVCGLEVCGVSGSMDGRGELGWKDDSTAHSSLLLPLPPHHHSAYCCMLQQF